MKIGCFFPSYGDQFVTMAKDLYNDSRLIQEYFEEASCCLDTNFVKLCFASSENELGKIKNAYPALFLTNSSIIALLKSLGIECSLVGGYGIGEYGALNAAGSLSLPDGLYILSKLALFFNEQINSGDYASITIHDLNDKLVLDLCEQTNKTLKDLSVERAIKWSGSQSIVTGTQVGIDMLKAALIQEKFDSKPKIKTAPVQAGLFSGLSNNLISALSVYLEKIDFKDCTIDWVSGTDGKIFTRGESIRETILGHLGKPMRIDKSMKTFENVDCILVPSPGLKTAAKLQELYPKKLILPIAAYDDIERVVNILAQVNEEADPAIETAHVVHPAQISQQ